MNPGDIPAPHRPLGASKKSNVDDDVVFNAGALSFVEDWVADGGGSVDAGDVVDPEPTIGGQSQQQRLGLGAETKRPPKKHREDPTALEKKLARKRRRQQEEAELMREVSLHGVVEDGDDDGIGGSKTASFSAKKARSHAPGTQEQADRTGAELQDKVASGLSEGRKQRKIDEKVNGGERGVPSDMVRGRRVKEDANHTRDGVDKPKKRRGWSKGHTGSKDEGTTKSIVSGTKLTPKLSEDAHAPVPEPEPTAPGAAVSGDPVPRPPPRRKTRSRQKNIRKDKRPLDKRPPHLRLGNPEFSGRPLTEETRQRLGLPQVDDKASAPSLGGDQSPDPNNCGCVVDESPSPAATSGRNLGPSM
ncbi:unnamed protein product, partial [Discosporangium mesarthrocarpum]